tara:strand:- start:170 stop:466 length:297 start_codon:yes stop_codon:yes gene_type:complete
LIQPLIKKFNAKSKAHLLLIFFVFGLSGSFSLWISSPIISALDLKNILNNYSLYIILRILIVIPIYQLILIVFAFIFGEFDYFWSFEKKFLKRIKIIK